jgi:hypothetical protein
VAYTYPNRINAILYMCDERVVERAHDMEDAVYCLDVRQERVAQARSLRRSLDQTRNIRDL